jgi:hypothetical protein
MGKKDGGRPEYIRPALIFGGTKLLVRQEVRRFGRRFVRD